MLPRLRSPLRSPLRHVSGRTNQGDEVLVSVGQDMSAHHGCVTSQQVLEDWRDRAVDHRLAVFAPRAVQGTESRCPEPLQQPLVLVSAVRRTARLDLLPLAEEPLQVQPAEYDNVKHQPNESTENGRGPA